MVQINSKKLAKLTSNKFVRFLFAALINTAFGYIVYATLIFFDAPYAYALLIANIAGIIFNYLSYGKILFKDNGNLYVFLKFVAAYAGTYFFNVMSLELLISNFKLGPYLAQLICIIPNATITWILINYWVYKKRN